MPYLARCFRHVFAATMVLGGCASVLSQEVSGLAVVLDADTIRVQETRIRLVGVDAPESDQICLAADGKRWLCGIAARDTVTKLIAGRPVRCSVTGEDVYKRKLATCTVADENINRWLVREGFALAYVKYSNEYVGEEKQARDSRRGLWAGAFIAPWDWRTRTSKTAVLGQNAASAPLSAIMAPGDTPPDPACAIKGNVNRKGDHIFHAPGQRDYGRVSMNSSAKRWFCSEEEALAAGWRKAHR